MDVKILAGFFKTNWFCDKNTTPKLKKVLNKMKLILGTFWGTEYFVAIVVIQQLNSSALGSDTG